MTTKKKNTLHEAMLGAGRSAEKVRHERDTLRARVAELEYQQKCDIESIHSLQDRIAELEAALDEIFIRSMSSTCTFNETQTIISHAKG